MSKIRLIPICSTCVFWADEDGQSGVCDNGDRRLSDETCRSWNPKETKDLEYDDYKELEF